MQFCHLPILISSIALAALALLQAKPVHTAGVSRAPVQRRALQHAPHFAGGETLHLRRRWIKEIFKQNPLREGPKEEKAKPLSKEADEGTQKLLHKEGSLPQKEVELQPVAPGAGKGEPAEAGRTARPPRPLGSLEPALRKAQAFHRAHPRLTVAGGVALGAGAVLGTGLGVGIPALVHHKQAALAAAEARAKADAEKARADAAEWRKHVDAEVQKQYDQIRAWEESPEGRKQRQEQAAALQRNQEAIDDCRRNLGNMWMDSASQTSGCRYPNGTYVNRI